MQWQEIRQVYPSRWLLVEAIAAHSEGDKRVLDQLAVVAMFDDSIAAMESYSRLHREAPVRELYVLHTSRDLLDIEERQWLGVCAMT